MDKATDSVSVEEVDVPAAASIPKFGNDELGKLQNILIGDHARATVDRIDTLEQALLGVIEDLRAELQQRVSELDARITAEADTRGTAMSNITSRIDEEAETNTTALKDLRADLRSTESDMQSAVETASSGLAVYVDELRESTDQTAKDLNASKVDRNALARLLSAAVEGLETGDDSGD